MSTIKADNVQTLAGASAPMTDVVNGSARAWVNFNGTGTPAIRAAYNVTSITDNGAGDYTVNFTTAMPSANYAVAGSATNSGQTASSGACSLGVNTGFAGQLAGSVRVIQLSGSASDRDNMAVVVFA